MTTKKLVNHLGAILLVIVIMSGLSFFFYKVDEKNHLKADFERKNVEITNRTIELYELMKFSCVRCGYENEQWMRIILADGKEIDSLRAEKRIRDAKKSRPN